MEFKWVLVDYGLWQYLPPLGKWDGHPVATVTREGVKEWYWHPSGEWGIGLSILGGESGLTGPYKTSKEAKQACEAYERHKHEEKGKEGADSEA